LENRASFTITTYDSGILTTNEQQDPRPSHILYKNNEHDSASRVAVLLVLKGRIPCFLHHVEAEKPKLTEKGLFVLKEILSISFLFEPLDGECACK
jgi:hypothetical protein